MLVTRAFGKWREWGVRADHAKWGGEPAAALLTNYLEPDVLTLYAEKLPARLLVDQRITTARPNDAHNLVEIRRPVWGAGLDNRQRADLVPEALVYADLLTTGDARCNEAAQLIYEQHLARLFTAT
jgi:hypothetical protein